MNLKSKAKENISYKKIVDKESHNELKQISKYSKALWIRLIELHPKKMNYVITEDFSIPTKNISQSEIFRNQLDKYLYKDITVAVLSSFPIFIFDYYGVNYTLELISKKNKV